MFKGRDVCNEDDADACVHYGTAFPPLEEDEQPARKPVPIHEQIVTDERGKQRFHGAFTGGFSAGFWNTVGSKEGFEPSTFQSSRSNRQSMKQFTVQDFLDAEDVNEFGIAPKRLKVNEDFLSSNVAEKKTTGDIIEKHIRANPVDLGIRLLRRLGVRDGKGVGAPVERSLMLDESVDDEIPTGKVYSCARPPPEWDLMQEPDSIEPDVMRKFKLAPDDVATFVIKNHKTNRKGIGYECLDPESFVGQKSSNFVSKSVTGMSGQAFGVGAFEEDDDDIYAQENMKNYDFEIGPAKLTDRRDANRIGLGVAEGFVKASKGFSHECIPAPNVPSSYKPRVPSNVLEIWEKKKHLEPAPSKPLVFVGVRKPDSSDAVRSSKVTAVVKSDPKNPFDNETNSSSSKHLEWESSSAEQVFKPSLLPTNSRFVSAGKLDTLSNRVVSDAKPETPREKAARLKMFGKLTRTTQPYQFVSVVCKRFNVKMTVENSYEPKAFDQKSLMNQNRKSRFSDATKPHNTQMETHEFFEPEKPKRDSFSSRVIAKSTFLKSLNDSEISTSSKPEKIASQKLTSSKDANISSSNGRILSQDNTIIDETSFQTEIDPSQNVEGNSVLDSLKNLNLLLDVFGDDEDETEESSDASTRNTSESAAPFRIASESEDPPNDFDCFSKFFQVPDASNETRSTNHEPSRSEDDPEKITEKREQSAIESEDEGEFGPDLPPELLTNHNSLNSLNSNGRPDMLQSSVKEECDLTSFRDVSSEFVEKVRNTLEQKKKKKSGRNHKKSRSHSDRSESTH